MGVEAAKDTLCRNVTIYGRCRYEDKGSADDLASDMGCH
jgi:PAB-dependent poly(A)-specific ribonuclease subunit 3